MCLNTESGEKKMFKLIKFLIKLALFLILLAVVGVGVILFLAYDGDKIPYEEKPEVDNLEVLVADDIHTSLDAIALSNYEDNNLCISFSVDEINAAIIEMIRSKKPEYLTENNDSIISFMGMDFKGIFFEINEGNLSGKAYFDAFDFYKSTVALEVNAEIYADNKLIVTFQNLKVGKGIKLSRSLVTKVMSLFVDLIPEVEMVDVKNLSLTLDLASYLTKVSDNPIINNLILSGDYVLETNEDLLLIKLDTSRVITGESDIKDGSIINVEDVISNFEYQEGLKGSVTISEANFNYLIQEEFEDDLASFTKTIVIGNEEFSFSLNDFYFDVVESCVYTSLNINNCSTSAKLKVELTEVMNDLNELESIDLKVLEVTIGQETFTGVESMLETVSIPASKLSFSILTLTDFEIIDGTNQIKLVGKISLL